MAKRNTNVPDSVKRFAKQDIREIIDKVNKTSDYNKQNIDASLVDLKYDVADNGVTVTAIINYNSGKARKQTQYHLQYTFEGDDVWLEYTVNTHSRWLYSRLTNPSMDEFSKDITAASLVGKRAIMAADDEDPGFGDFEDEDFGDDDTFQDTLDDMADNIEDMQDDLDEVEEDDTSIEVENNIEGHYIAECDRCHGIFISAMVQSDQEVEKMSGICPLCQKESDQYFRWVVQAIDDVE